MRIRHLGSVLHDEEDDASIGNTAWELEDAWSRKKKHRTLSGMILLSFEYERFNVLYNVVLEMLVEFDLCACSLRIDHVKLFLHNFISLWIQRPH